ncbi:MAG: HAD family hydrolase [Erysipelotrichaceae bacterium]|nr:HAD family hydrolase [Erysipelotrichaceae bacterium]
MQKIKAILFDFDDTLGDRYRYTYRTYANYIEEKAGDADPLLKEAMKQDCLIWDMRGNYVKSFVFQELQKKYGIPLPSEDCSTWWKVHNGQDAVTFPEVRETLLELKKRYKLAILTNGSTYSQMSKIRSAGIEDLFDYILTSEEAGAGKPKTRMFEKALEALQVEKEEALYVGDTFSTDILGAKRAGIPCIWIVPKGRPCDYPIERIEHIKELLERY